LVVLTDETLFDPRRWPRVSANPPERGQLDGLSIDDALEEIDPADGEGSDIRAALGHVAEDGTVSADAAEAGLSETSLLISTIENRAEVASHRLSDARKTAAQKPDLDVIDRRLSRFETRMAGIRDDRDAVSEQLETIFDRFDETMPLYELGAQLRSLTKRARSIQQTADELYMDLDDFETWLEDPQQRQNALHADLDAIADTLSGLQVDLELLEREDTNESVSSSELPSNPGVTWVDATYRSYVVELLLDDVRSEHAELRDWVENGASDPDTTSESDPTVVERLQSLQAELERLDDRLETVAIPEWHERFDDDIEQFQAAIAEPVDWGKVQATLETYRERIESHC
jgi:DNA-binding phage protein